MRLGGAHAGTKERMDISRLNSAKDTYTTTHSARSGIFNIKLNFVITIATGGLKEGRNRARVYFIDAPWKLRCYIVLGLLYTREA